MPSREKDQADFDLERFIDMFDEALTSRDERVINALRSLMMMTILTKTETYNSPAIDRERGPLRRMHDEVNHLWRRFEQMEIELKQMHQRISASETRTSGTWPRKESYQNEYNLAANQLAQHINNEAIKNAVQRINQPGGLSPVINVPAGIQSGKGLLKK